MEHLSLDTLQQIKDQRICCTVSTWTAVQSRCSSSIFPLATSCSESNGSEALLLHVQDTCTTSTTLPARKREVLYRITTRLCSQRCWARSMQCFHAEELRRICKLGNRRKCPSVLSCTRSPSAKIQPFLQFLSPPQNQISFGFPIFHSFPTIFLHLILPWLRNVQFSDRKHPRGQLHRV